MGKEVISKFKDKPINKSTWIGMWLGLASILAFPLLGINAKFLRPILGDVVGEGTGSIVTAVFAFLCIMLIVIGFIANLRSYRRGERSWVMWLGFVPSILVGTLFAIMLGAEIFEAIRSAITGEPMRY